MNFITIIPLSVWVILALCILAYCAFGVGGIVAVVVLGVLLS